MCLQDPASLVSDELAVGMISPVIKLTIERIDHFVVTVRRRKLYLRKNTTLDELLDYYARNFHTYQHKYDIAALSQENHRTGLDQKVPVLSVPNFVGDSLDGQEFVDNVVRKFKCNGQLSYFEDNEFCDDLPAWSEVFSSHLLDSLANRDILGYLSTELKDECNCAEV